MNAVAESIHSLADLDASLKLDPRSTEALQQRAAINAERAK